MAAEPAKPTIYLFTADWCGPCQLYHHEYTAPGSILKKELDSKYTIVECDADHPTNLKYMQMHGIDRLPAFVFKTAPKTKHTTGYVGRKQLLQSLRGLSQ